MTTITGGKVRYARTVRPADFESASAEAELTFVLDEGEDPDKVLREWGQKVRAAALDLVDQRTSERMEGPPPPSQDTAGRRPFRRREESDDDPPF